MSKKSEKSQSIVSEDLIIDGNIESSGTVAIHGTVNGHVAVSALLLEPSGSIKGNVKADQAELKGSQKGKVVAQTLIVHSGAKLSGSVKCQALTVESGAEIAGKFQVKPG